MDSKIVPSLSVSYRADILLVLWELRELSEFKRADFPFVISSDKTFSFMFVCSVTFSSCYDLPLRQGSSGSC